MKLTFTIFVFFLLFQPFLPSRADSTHTPDHISSLSNQVFQQSPHPVEDGFCLENSQKPLPNFLRTLQRTLQEHSNLDAASIRSSLISICQKPIYTDLGVDAYSTYFHQTQKLPNPNIFSGQERPSKFSGASPKNIKILQDQDVRFFLENLFHHITDASDHWNSTKLSRSDLFHGHIVYSLSNHDFVIVFHSKEYVNGEPSVQEGFPRRRLLEHFGEMLPSDYSLAHPSPKVTRRNFLWSLKHNKLCAVDTTRNIFRNLRVDEGDPSTLDPIKVTELREEGEIANINYFPNEHVPLFLDFHRGFTK